MNLQIDQWNLPKPEQRKENRQKKRVYVSDKDRQKADRDLFDLSRTDWFQTIRGRHSPVGKGVPVKREVDTWSLYSGFGEWEVKCSFRGCGQSLLPGVVCADKSVLSLATALPSYWDAGDSE